MRFFTSDLHLGHRNIIAHCDRPFTCLEAMHKAMVGLWNETVGPHDVVYILGDLHLGRFSDVAHLIPQLNGHKVLIPGNHDACWVGHHGDTKRARAMGEMLAAGITAIAQPGYLPNVHLANGIWVDLHHFPHRSNHPNLPGHDERHREHWPPDTGRWLLHGHVHNRWKMWASARQLNVGVDQWGFRPVSAATLAEWITLADNSIDKQTGGE